MKFSLNELELRDMTPDEMKAAYLGHMINVFPENELKPCDSIYQEMLEDKYLACGLYAGEELVGYVFTACIPGREQLFGQYVVVKEEYRSMGVGAVMLDKVMEHYSGYRCFMADVEDPDYPTDDEDLAQRERRMRFYTRNGFRRTRVKGLVYDVDYEVIVRGISASPDDDEVFEAANAIYESMAYPGTFPDKFRLRIEYDLEDRGIERKEFSCLQKTGLIQKHIDIAGFSGNAALMNIDETSYDWVVHSASGDAVIAAPGYTWLQLVPDERKWWLTVMYDTSGSPVQYYFDVVHSVYTSESGELRFRDLFVDVVMSADGTFVVLDRDELDDALEAGKIYKSEYDRAISTVKEIVSKLDNENYWRQLCKAAIEELNSKPVQS